MVVPFHRRILPWIFAAVFIVVAPVVIFYTSGYRWNEKKGRVERNGTVILDSSPRDARILMDGIPVGKTPLTLQDVAPGFHRFTIASQNFFPWEKTFDVQPERVTFAHRVRLWKKSAPFLIDESRAIVGLSSSDDERERIEFEDGTTTVAAITDTFRDERTRISFARRLSPQIRSRWSSDHRHVLIESLGSPPAILDVRSDHSPMELPLAAYRWEDAVLVGVATSVRVSIEFPSRRIIKRTLPHHVVDLFDMTELRTATGSVERVYVPQAKG
ncbi:MAG: PEGA domain-containing protein, partial [Patescibacteria group bacterium]